MNLSVHLETWPRLRPLRITGHEWESSEVVVVELSRDDLVGRGEAAGVYYLDETTASIRAQIEQVADEICVGIDRLSLLSLLPPGGARNAVDCALWDLETQSSRRSIWQLTGVPAKPLETVFTIGIEDTLEAMARQAIAAAAYPLLKIKLDGVEPLERLRAIRNARPDARIVVDANQAWTLTQLTTIAPAFAALGVQMIEQPLPRGADTDLEHYRSPVPLCADESCLHIGELGAAARRYQMINIKLDKTGGLTHALELASAARTHGLGVMVGCMGGTSLAMAPAFVLGCVSDFVDIDAPLSLKCDRLPALAYQGSTVSVFKPEVWGGAGRQPENHANQPASTKK
ncbi:MAG: N-acetyl-D-Glu racemase DgcA [Sterolibacterium sp.]|jgi:L-alanine-DL-glutamate epimerase-like enolase superfamily enzyme